MLNTKNFEKNRKEIKNILIVRQHHQLGDMLCTLPLFAAVRKKFPEANITLVASPDNSRILDNTVKHLIDEILIYDKKYLNFRKKLKSKKYDLSIVPSTASISRTSHIISFLSGSSMRVGVNSVNGIINKSAGLLNIKKDFDWSGKKIHQSERNLDIVRQIGCNLTTDEKKKVSLDLPVEKIRYAQEFFITHFPDKSKKIIALHLWAAKIQNRWNHSNFKNLILNLHKEFQPYFLLTPGPNDIDDAKKFLDNFIDNKINIIYPVIPVVELAAILKKVSLYITNDTGTMHISAYSKGKLLALFGPTHGYEWGPENETGLYIQSPDDNINNITVTNVLNKARTLLNK